MTWDVCTAFKQIIDDAGESLAPAAQVALDLIKLHDASLFSNPRFVMSLTLIKSLASKGTHTQRKTAIKG